MGLGRWGAFRDLEPISDRLNRLMAWPEVWRSTGKEMMAVTDRAPPVNISETGEEFHVEAESPE
jgi:HSP20 family molecular chaperone IbpA